jgi:ABC-type proline/glycine betaine transport system permease subunit
MPRTPRASDTHLPPGPGPVAAVHRILIVAALVCAVVYAAWEANQWAHSAETLALVRSAFALVVAVGIGLYLRSLRGLAAKLTPRS